MEKFKAGEKYQHVPVDTEIRVVDKEARIYDFVASTQNEDRHGTRLFGWELENYAKNSVILWSHNSSIPPIGRALRTWVDGNVLKIRIQFPPEGVHELADTVRKLVEHDYLRSGSVGFIPGRVVYPWERDEDERGDDDSIHLLDNELVEYSLTPVPSNPDALQLALGRGMIGDNVKDCFTINKEIDGSAFDEVREALTAWLETEAPEVDEGGVDEVDELVAERGTLLKELEDLRGASLLDRETIDTLSEAEAELREDKKLLERTIRVLTKRVEELEDGCVPEEVDRRLKEVEHRLKASKVINVEKEERGLEIPEGFLDKIDQVVSS